MSDVPGPSADAGEQRELLARLRAVIEAKDAENAVLRAELDAALERYRRLELRVAELKRRLGQDSTDSGTPPSKESIAAKERRKAGRRQRQESERERRKDRKRGGQPGHQGKGLARDPDPGERKEAGPPAECRSCKARPGRRAGRGLAVGAGHRRGSDPEGDRMGAAGPGVPVLRDGHVRGAAARRARRLGVLRGGAERRRGGADRVRERAARAGRAGHGHAAGRAGLAGLGG